MTPHHTASELHWRTREFFQAMPGGDALLESIPLSETVLIVGDVPDHPFFEALQSQWHVEWDEHQLYYAVLVPKVIADVLRWFATVEERDWGTPVFHPIPEWAHADLQRFVSIVARESEGSAFRTILDKVDWETRYGLTPTAALDVLSLACRLYAETAEDEEEAVQAALNAVTC